MADNIHIHDDGAIDTIDPNIYGHFIEHLGGATYGGIWVGDAADIETVDGIRADVLDLLSDISPPVFRWPGGCFADYYHWEDGIGDPDERPRRINVFWDGEESNAFGTEEFLQFCRLLDAEPFLALNLGTGTPEEAIKWVEYCNYDGDSEYAQMRADNGHPEPHGVKYWAVGNESWGCGGENDPDGYARDLRRYGNYLRALEDRFPTDMELVGVGHAPSVAWTRRYEAGQFALNDYDWNTRVLQALSKPDYSFSGTQFGVLDQLSIHRYVQAGGDVDFSEEQYYEIFANARNIGADVDRTANVLETYLPEREVGVYVDEWGVWHPQFDPQNAEYRQESTVRDALVAAAILDQFNNRADVVSMANIAMTTNVLHCLVQTNEKTAWKTPTYEVFDLYTPHMGALGLEVDVETAHRSVNHSNFDVPLVSASASRRDGALYLTASNRSMTGARRVEVTTRSPVAAASASGEVLFEGISPDAHSSAEGEKDRFGASELDVETGGDSIVANLPPSSLAAVRVDIDGN